MISTKKAIHSGLIIPVSLKSAPMFPARKEEIGEQIGKPPRFSINKKHISTFSKKDDEKANFLGVVTLSFLPAFNPTH